MRYYLKAKRDQTPKMTAIGSSATIVLKSQEAGNAQRAEKILAGTVKRTVEHQLIQRQRSHHSRAYLRGVTDQQHDRGDDAGDQRRQRRPACESEPMLERELLRQLGHLGRHQQVQPE
jgi:hypothetical protein